MPRRFPESKSCALASRRIRPRRAKSRCGDRPDETKRRVLVETFGLPVEDCSLSKAVALMACMDKMRQGLFDVQGVWVWGQGWNVELANLATVGERCRGRRGYVYSIDPYLVA